MADRVLPQSGVTDDGEWILVSPEMTAAIGVPTGDMPMPDDPLALAFRLGSDGPASLEIGMAGSGDIRLYVARAAWARLGGAAQAGGRFHLAPELRAIALALRDCAMSEEPRRVYRLAKSIELLCETMVRLRDGALLPLAAEALSPADTRRLMAARGMIDERWREKLTLEQIARACGLNREKLTRGFRALYGGSIGEALAERRLGLASRMLLTTDKPVSSIGYEHGYLSNASFARAFSRRFGVSPSDYRNCGRAA